jgi:hypothetical protein
MGIHIIDNEANLSDVINVPYGSTLNIEFAALDYLNPEKILYKYKIGNNSEWIILSPGQRSLNLPNTNPGEYNLKYNGGQFFRQKRNKECKDPLSASILAFQNGLFYLFTGCFGSVIYITGSL